MGDSTASRRVEATLRDEIRTERWRIGDRLPSERALTERFETSRVVVREALAALKSLGMVASKPGSGAYVTANRPQTPGLDIAAATHAEILDCLELRRAVETEAARLAAQRSSPSQLAEAAAALETMRRRIAAGESGADADWAFHVAVARASNNPFFLKTMSAFGPEAIPRIRRREDASGPDARERERQLLEEHDAIYEGLAAHDAAAAAAAMRLHLTHALRRYRAEGPHAIKQSA